MALTYATIRRTAKRACSTTRGKTSFLHARRLHTPVIGARLATLRRSAARRAGLSTFRANIRISDSAAVSAGPRVLDDPRKVGALARNTSRRGTSSPTLVVFKHRFKQFYRHRGTILHIKCISVDRYRLQRTTSFTTNRDYRAKNLPPIADDSTIRFRYPNGVGITEIGGVPELTTASTSVRMRFRRHYPLSVAGNCRIFKQSRLHYRYTNGSPFYL